VMPGMALENDAGVSAFEIKKMSLFFPFLLSRMRTRVYSCMGTSQAKKCTRPFCRARDRSLSRAVPKDAPVRFAEPVATT
jgi:hypothetical protein